MEWLLLKSKTEILLPLERHQNDKFFTLFTAFGNVMLSGAKHLDLNNTPWSFLAVAVAQGFRLRQGFAGRDGGQVARNDRYGYAGRLSAEQLPIKNCRL